MKFRLILSISAALFLTSSINIANASENADIKIIVDKYSETIPSSLYSSWITNQTSLREIYNYRSEIENINYCALDKIICQLLKNRKTALKTKAITVTTVDQEKIKQYVHDLARKVNTDPTDAKFTIQDGRVTAFTSDEPGITLDEEKSTQQLTDVLNQKNVGGEVKFNFSTKEPKVKAADVNNLGVSDLIGQGKSNFKGSPRNRIHNIKTAAARFNGVLIKPGEEFSFVKFLGDVDGEHGYLPELVIKKNKTEPEFGGGICQVSTTVFRAAVYSGLKVTARSNHAYPVSYYNPAGMDSTIYVPKPDLKFINNTQAYILMEIIFNGTEITVNFYGTKDGRTVEVTQPTILEANPDKSMKTTFSQKVTDANGNMIINDAFNSSYQSPYKFPHPGDPILKSKPANWSDDEWKNYKKAWKEANPGVKL